MKTNTLILLKRVTLPRILYVILFLFKFYYVGSAQSTAMNQPTGFASVSENLKSEVELLTGQYLNSTHFVQLASLALTRPIISDSSSVKSGFSNSIMCSAFVLRTAKSSEFTIREPNVHLLRVFGLSYERKIYKHVTLGIGYFEWLEFTPWFNDVEISPDPLVIQAGHERGTIERFTNYKMCDVFGEYYLKLGHHKIEGGLGISYTWGTNTVIDTIYSLPSDNYVMSHREWTNYEGILTFIGYDYSFLHNRLSIGYRINWRDYFRMYSPQVLNGLTAKFNF